MHLNSSLSDVGHAPSNHLHPFSVQSEHASSSGRSSKSTFEHYAEGDESPSKDSLKRKKSHGLFSSFRRKVSSSHSDIEQLPTLAPPGGIPFPGAEDEDSSSATSSHHHERNRVSSMFKKLAPHKVGYPHSTSVNSF